MPEQVYLFTQEQIKGLVRAVQQSPSVNSNTSFADTNIYGEGLRTRCAIVLRNGKKLIIMFDGSLTSLDYGRRQYKGGITIEGEGFDLSSDTRMQEDIASAIQRTLGRGLEVVAR